MSGLRQVIFVMFTEMMLKKDNAQHVYLIVFAHDNLLSMSLELGHDIYLFLSWGNSSINFSQLWILKNIALYVIGVYLLLNQCIY